MRAKLILSIVFVVVSVLAAGLFSFEIERHATFTLSSRSLLFFALIAVFVIFLVAFLLLSFFSKTQKKSFERMSHLAKHDTLTDLPNRTSFFAFLKEHITKAKENNSYFALIYLDIDHFKTINDNFGHEIGDRLLQVIARRLHSCLRESDFIARIGGDAFAIVLTDLVSLDIDEIVRRLQMTIGTSYNFDDNEVRLTTSMGVARFPKEGETALTIIKHAEIAVYAAKDQGRNNCQFFTEQLIKDRLQDAYMENALPFALERDEFFLMYQPQVHAVTKKLVGMEVLLRWRHPKLGVVSPAKFVPLIEKAGLIGQVSERILATACKQYKLWFGDKTDITMSINLSPRQLMQHGFVGRVIDIVEEAGISPEGLHLEITETAVISNLDLAEKILLQLTAKGFRVVVDDFGTGYASMSYLKRLPISAVKIDRSFIINVATNHNDAVIVESTLNLAQGLGLEVVVEGVETEEQLDFFRQHGEVIVQGYYFSEPLIADVMGQYIDEHVNKSQE